MPRPAPRFHEFIGHKKEVDYLRRLLEGAQARKEPFPHSLFLGPSGVGKTMLARALAAEFGTRVINVMGDADRLKLTQKFAELNATDFLFIDECHRLRPLEQELLCEAMDNNSIPSVGEKRGDPKVAEDSRIALPDWTIVLATDQPGSLLDALCKRTINNVNLSFYSIDETKEIVDAMASDLSILISPQAAKLIAEIAGGLPRRAKQLLKSLRLFFPNADRGQISEPQVRTFLEQSGFSTNGLNATEQRYLQILFDLGGASLETIALSLGIDSDYVRRQIEPNLMQRRLIRISSAGRSVSSLGEELLEESRRRSQPHMKPNGTRK